MPTKVEQNGVSNADLERAIADFRADQSPENERRVSEYYAALSGYSGVCTSCIAARKSFVEGLKEATNGDVIEGAAKMAGAVRGAIAINIGKIFGVR